MCRIDLCGQIGVKISSYGDRRFIKINPLNCPMGQFIRREDRLFVCCQPKYIYTYYTVHSLIKETDTQ